MNLVDFSLSTVIDASILVALFQVILIDVIMSSDNALMIGVTTQTLKKKDRKKAILFGVIGAAVLRILFAIALSHVLEIPLLKIVGGLLLFGIAAKLYRQFRDQKKNHNKHRSSSKRWQAIGVIMLADISMSMDNILAVVGAADHHMIALGIGIVLSIILMTTIATRISQLLERYPWIQRIGFVVIVFIGFKLLLAGIDIVIPAAVRATLLGIGAFLGCLTIIYLHSRHLTQFEEEAIAPYLYKHAPFLITFLLLVIALGLLFGRSIHDWLDMHMSVLYTIFVCVFLLGLEMASMEKVKWKHAHFRLK